MPAPFSSTSILSDTAVLLLPWRLILCKFAAKCHTGRALAVVKAQHAHTWRVRCCEWEINHLIGLTWEITSGQA